ncbi:hypothetical protein ACQP2K_29615 [Microbispora siamensis]
MPRLRLQVFDRDADGRDDLLARGETDDQGDYELCFGGSDDDESGGQDVYVTGLSYNDYWSVVDPENRSLYTFTTPVVPDVERGDREIVSYLSSPGSTDEGVFRIFTAAHATWKAYTGWAGNPGGCWVAARRRAARYRLSGPPTSRSRTPCSGTAPLGPARSPTTSS